MSYAMMTGEDYEFRLFIGGRDIGEELSHA